MLKRAFPWLCAVAIFLGPLHVAFTTFVSPGALLNMSVAEKMKETAPMCVEIPCVIQSQIIPVALAPSGYSIATLPSFAQSVIGKDEGTPHVQQLPASHRIRAPDFA
jgi:hypothetical protein